jgi:hypothetical protein
MWLPVPSAFARIQFGGNPPCHACIFLLEQNRNKLPQSVADEERKEKKVSGSTELMPGGASAPLATLPLLGALPLIKGEDAERAELAVDAPRMAAEAQPA